MPRVSCATYWADLPVGERSLLEMRFVIFLRFTLSFLTSSTALRKAGTGRRELLEISARDFSFVISRLEACAGSVSRGSRNCYFVVSFTSSAVDDSFIPVVELRLWWTDPRRLSCLTPWDRKLLCCYSQSAMS